MIGLTQIITLKEGATYLKNCCKDVSGFYPLSYNGYYCGITNDLNRRANEHNAKILGHVDCGSFETAKKLESMMHDEGFDTGKQLGNGQEDSKYVYVYKKVKGVTNESLDN